LNKELLEGVAGGTDLLAWFEGRVPSFHDAEVLALRLDRHEATCQVKIYTFEITAEVDGEGYLVTTKHVVVSFELSHVTALNLKDFNHQNVIYGLSITQMPDGDFCLALEPCWGLSGEINARSLQITLEPGAPTGSQSSRGRARPWPVAAFEQGGESAAALELRRLFPGVMDDAAARECARIIASKSRRGL
jgi:hypothetical protein